MLWHSIYTGAKWHHRSTVFNVDFEHITPSSSVSTTARKTIFSRSWNIIESSKRPCEYHLSINFLTQKKDRISHHRKVQNKNLPVISKYHISVDFVAQEKTVFPISENVKTRTFQYSINIIFPLTFWLKNTISFISKKFKTRTFKLSEKMIFHAKENNTSLFFVFHVKLNHPLPHFLGHPSFVITIERSSLYQLTELKKVFFAPRNS